MVVIQAPTHTGLKRRIIAHHRPIAQPVSAQRFLGTTLPALIWRGRFVLFVACVLVFCYGYYRPTPPPEFFSESDKVEHVLAFSGLGLCSALVAASARVQMRALVWGLLFVAAPLTEWLQHILQPATRDFSLGDIAGNLTGAVLALIVWHWVRRWVRKV